MNAKVNLFCSPGQYKQNHFLYNAELAVAELLQSTQDWDEMDIEGCTKWRKPQSWLYVQPSGQKSNPFKWSVRIEMTLKWEGGLNSKVNFSESNGALEAPSDNKGCSVLETMP